MADRSRVATRCPNCEKLLKTQMDWVGRNVRCPACDTPFTIASLVVSDSHEPSAGVSVVETAPATDQGTGTPGGRSDNGASTPEREPSLGRIDRFEMKEVLGSGGFGVVYRAWDPTLSRVVALKVPRFAASDQKRLRRFTAEARAAARLRHPNIVAVHESGQAGEQPFIAYEYVKGETLADRIRRQRPAFAETARWVRDLASALHYAHSEGVVHRDVKPDNIIVNDRSQPQILDFGLARRGDDDST